MKLENLPTCKGEGCIHKDGCPDGCRSPITFDMDHLGEQIGGEGVEETLRMLDKVKRHGVDGDHGTEDIPV